MALRQEPFVVYTYSQTLNILKDGDDCRAAPHLGRKRMNKHAHDSSLS